MSDFRCDRLDWIFFQLRQALLDGLDALIRRTQAMGEVAEVRRVPAVQLKHTIDVVAPRFAYPSRGETPWPAHPNALSFIEIVFKDEVSAADQAGKETSLEALARLTPEQRRGALGAHKDQVFNE